LRPSILIAGIALVSFASRVMPVTSGDAAAAGNGGASPRAHQSSAARSLVLCNGLLGGGFLDGVVTVAPMPVTAARPSDPKQPIQFGSIWSDTHQATVGQSTAPPPPALQHSKAVAAAVNLPITFSSAERLQFEAAGWKQFPGPGGRGTSFCLEHPGHGMFCVSGGP